MTGGSPHVAEISGDADIRHSQDITDMLRSALAAHDVVLVSLDEATCVDVSTLQVLLAAHKQAKSLGKSLAMAGPAKGRLRKLLTEKGFLDVEGEPIFAEARFWVTPLQQPRDLSA
nr:STAS domain-containing protein [Devosia marina]